MAKYCGNCSDPLPASHRCSCGWFDKDHAVWGRDCAYQHGGRQCPAPGALSFSIKGGAPWYCAAHFRNIHDKQACIAILDDYDKHGVPHNPNWRDVMIDEFGKPKENADAA